MVRGGGRGSEGEKGGWCAEKRESQRIKRPSIYRDEVYSITAETSDKEGFGGWIVEVL